MGYLKNGGHGSEEQRHSLTVGFVDPTTSVVPSANVTVLALNARACGSFAGHPEIVIMVPTFSRSL